MIHSNITRRKSLTIHDRKFDKLLVFGMALALVFSVSYCNEKGSDTLTIEAMPIQATVDGDILVGPSILNDPERFVWGGSVVHGEDGKYHMLYSTWLCGDSLPPFSDSWVLHSEIAYAVSDHPDRDFKFQKIVLKGRNAEGDSTYWDAQMVHNPHLKKFKDTYYLYYIGSVDPGVQPSHTKGADVSRRDRIQQNQKIGVIEFGSFADLLHNRFERPDKPLLSPRTRVKPDRIVDASPEGTEPKPDNIIVVNPSVEFRPSDGKYLLYFKGNVYEPHWKGIHGVAIGDHPTGPFTALDEIMFDIPMSDGSLASAEDPFVWYHNQDEIFYAVFKDFSGTFTEDLPGLAILQSQDGIDWTKPDNPFFMPKALQLQDGRQVEVKRLERPQFLIDPEGDPLVMYAACALVNVGPRQDGSSFNVQVPIAVK